MEPSQERREKIQELVSKIRHEEQNERKERSTKLRSTHLRQILQTKAAKESNLQRLGIYYTTYLGLLSYLNNSLLLFNDLYKLFILVKCK